MISSYKRMSPLLVVPCVAVALVVSVWAQAAQARETRAAPASAPGLIPVWAYVNGAYPVAGGRVVIVAGGKPVRQLTPRTSGRTNANGVALVSVRRVPRRFSVVVQGGRAGGRRLTGSLRSLTGSDPDAGVVEVNPLTALIAQLRGQRPRLGLGQASRAVKRYFGVPWWADLGQNLRDGPQWFSARAYVRDVRRYGSIDRLNRAMARRILRGLSGFRETSQPARFSSAIQADGFRPATPAARVASKQTPGERVSKVFELLGSTAAGIGAQGAVGGVLGALLELAKTSGVPVPKGELEQAQEQLSAIGAQLTQLQGQVSNLELRVANADARQLIHHSDDVIGAIKYATGQLVTLAEANQTDEQRENLAAKITKDIGKNLLKAPATLDLHLNPEVALGDNAIKATSRALAAKSRFFGPLQSNEVRDVYDYFATYQAQLGVLLMNYWNAHPKLYSVDFKKIEIAKLGTSVTKAQQKSLKPTVPDNTVIDTRTRNMWTTNFPTGAGAPLPEVNLRTIAEVDYSGTGSKPRYRLLKPAGPVALGQFPFGDWRIPSVETLRGLISGWSGPSPIGWLQKEAGFNRQFLEIGDGRKWTRDIPSITQILFLRTMDVRTFSLRTGNVYGDSAIAWVPNDAWTGEFDRFRAGLVYYRPIPTDETYWW